MRFLFVAPRFHTNQFAIVKNLLEKGHQVKYFVQYAGVSEDHSCLEPLFMKKSLITKALGKYYEYRYDENASEKKKFENFIPSFLTLYNDIRRYNPDIVILRERSLTSMLAYIICKVLGIECTLIYNQSPLYSHVASSQSNLKKLIRKYLFPRVRITTVKSRNVNRFAENEKDYFIDEKDYFLPFVVEANHSAVEREYFKNGKINILDVGKYRDYKNHFVLVDAINKIKQKSNLSVTIVGQVSNNEEKKYYNSLKEYIVNHNLDSIIKLKKNMKFNDMNDLYLTHDIFILPSKVETASISVLEAMANAMVTISTDENGTASYIKENINGNVFLSGNSFDLACKINEYLNNKKLIPTHGNNSYCNIVENYSFENYYYTLNNILFKEFNRRLE